MNEQRRLSSLLDLHAHALDMRSALHILYSSQQPAKSGVVPLLPCALASQGGSPCLALARMCITALLWPT